MTEKQSQDSPEDGADRRKAVVTQEEFAASDLEAPIRESNKVDCHSLADLYEAAFKEREQSGTDIAARVYRLVANVTDMHFKPDDVAEPFGPKFTLADGRRSMIASDLRGEQCDVFRAVVADIANPGLRARLSDVVWHNDRKRSDMAQLAVDAYCEAVRAVFDSEAEFFRDRRAATSVDGRDMLCRACQIARATGWKDPEGSCLKTLVQTVSQDAFDRGDHRGFLNGAELGLRFGIDEPTTLARNAETLVAKDSPNGFTSRELWQLAAIAHGKSGQDAERDRCLASAAECFVALAEEAGGGGMVAASHLMNAIEELRRLPNTGERRQQLEARLRDAQGSIRDEMGVISTEIDLTELVRESREGVGGLSLVQAFGAFAQLSVSPEPAALKEEARKQAEEHPLSSLFPMSMVDDEGKIVSKSPALVGDDDGDDLATHHHIARNEDFRRQVAVSGLIDPARRVIQVEHPVEQRDFLPLVAMSPFVPEDRTEVFSLAFARFFGGDFIAALHVLVPQLENSLRYILKQVGKDPSSIRSNMTQENRNLSVLLSKDRGSLEEVLGPAIVYEIENLFDFRGGPAIRHQLAHGMFSTQACYGTDAIYACWFIFRLCCLPVFEHWEKLDEWMKDL